MSRSSCLCNQATIYQAPIIHCTGFLFYSPMSVWTQLQTSAIGKVSKNLQEMQAHSLVRYHNTSFNYDKTDLLP